MAILKVEEFQGASGRWYVSDVHTWTGWQKCAELLGAPTLEGFLAILETKYDATIESVVKYEQQSPLIIFSWDRDQYKKAHQFKLDVNRIARQKKFEVERAF